MEPYENLEIEIILFEPEDIIVTSGEIYTDPLGSTGLPSDFGSADS